MITRPWNRLLFGGTALLSRRTPRTLRKATGRRRAARLGLEVLEDRAVPAVFTVNTLADTIDNNPNVTSLREAVRAANARDGADEVQFATKLEGAVILTSGRIRITSPLIIAAPDLNEVTVVGLNSKAFWIDPRASNVTIDDELTVMDGRKAPVNSPQRPRLLGVTPIDATTLVLDFNTRLGKSASEVSSYNIPGLTIEKVITTKYPNRVVLVTSPQDDVPYKLSLNNLLARDGRKVQVINEKGALTGIDSAIDLEPPRVVGAVSLGNNKVLVSFSEPMADSSLDPAHYAITQATFNSEAGALTVRGDSPDVAPIFYNDDHTAVVLTTSPQNELTYTVKVVNVTDLAGNAFAPPVLAAGGQRIVSDQANFTGKPPSVDQLVDSDGDGLSDNDELRGWLVTVTPANYIPQTRGVTSDPFNVDTDGDGFTDDVEAQLRLDPRDPDSDDDLLTDWQEYTEIFSDHLKGDSDGDGVDDGTEFLGVKSSPVFADTDGDQIPDGLEIPLGGPRNILVSDLPRPEISVGGVNLALDVRFTESNNRETRDLGTETVRTTLANASTETTTNQHTANVQVGLSAGYTGGLQEGGFTSLITGSAQLTAGYSYNYTHETADESRREYEKSLQTEREVSQGFTVERTLVGATMQVAVNLHNLSDLAYRVQNLQVTALILDPLDHSRLTPVATLTPDFEPKEGFTLGPLVADRGPIIFSNDTIIPSLVESLMANSTGLIFRISNYDIVDEADRNFAFTSQEVVERTGAVLVDFGGANQLLAQVNGEAFDQVNPPPQVESYRVATATGRAIADTNGDGRIDPGPARELLDSNGNSLGIDADGDGQITPADDTFVPDRRVTFDPVGRLVGITFHQALGSIGLVRYDETATPTANLSDVQIHNSYSTIKVGNQERIYRIREIANDSVNDRYWQILGPQGIVQDADLDHMVLTSDSPISLNFVQDLDKDGLPADVEYFLRTSDSDRDGNGDGLPDGRDTDGDGLDDRFEALGGWQITTPQRSYRVYSSPNRADSNFDAPTTGVDSDGDGVEDRLEYDGSDFAAAPAGWNDQNSNGLRDRGEVSQLATGDRVLDPVRKDTDGDGIDDATEVIGYPITPITGGTRLVSSNPNTPFTDSDTFSDGLERILGLDPTDPADTDEDGDGLPDSVERAGWAIGRPPVEVIDLAQARVPSITNILAEYVTFFSPIPSWGTGTRVRVESTGGGLTAGTDYFLRRENLILIGDVFSFYTSAGAAQAGGSARRVDLTGIITTRVSPLTTVGGVEGVSLDPYAQGPLTGRRATSSTDSVDSDSDGLTDYDEYFLATDPRSKDSDNDGIPDRVETLGYALGHQVGGENLGIIRTNPLDADTDNDMLSDGAEAELTDADFDGNPEPVNEQSHWVVRVRNAEPYRAFSSPLVADADFDGIVDGVERPRGTDPNNGNTDGDKRDDGAEITGGTNPLAEDFRVTVAFSRLHLLTDGAGGTELGDISFDLAVRLPGTGSAGLSTSVEHVVMENLGLGLDRGDDHGLPLWATTGISEVEPTLVNGTGALQNDPNRPGLRFNDNSDLRLDRVLPVEARSLTFGMTPDQSFSVEALIAEIDDVRGGIGNAGHFVYLGGIDGVRAQRSVPGSTTTQSIRPVFRGTDLQAETSSFIDLSIPFTLADNVAFNSPPDPSHISGTLYFTIFIG